MNPQEPLPAEQLDSWEKQAEEMIRQLQAAEDEEVEINKLVEEVYNVER